MKRDLLNRKNWFVEQEKLCWNCLAKGYILKNCETEVRCRVSNCNKQHHTLLQGDISLKTNGVQHNSFNRSSIHKTNLDIKVSFIIAKSRLALLKEKSLTIPKPELQAPLIASRLKVKILGEKN